MELRPCGITGLSNSFWIYAVKAKLHTYNVTPIKRADYKTLKELWSGIKPNISHLQVFRCLAWVHILKKRRHKLEPKSQAMIFIRYEDGSKGYIFWDAAHQHFKMSHDVKFEETRFPAKEMILAPSSDYQFLKSDSDSDSSGLDLVKLVQPPTRPPSPDQSTQPTVTAPSGPVMSSLSAPPTAPPLVPWRTSALPDMETAPLQPPTPQYSLHPTKQQLGRQTQARPSTDSINNILIHMFQEAPNPYQEAVNSPEKDKWLAVSQEEFDGLTEMGVWKLADHPSDHKTIKCRWTYVSKSNGHYKARLVAKGYTQVQGIDYKETFSPVVRYESI